MELISLIVSLDMSGWLSARAPRKPAKRTLPKWLFCDEQLLYNPPSLLQCATVEFLKKDKIFRLTEIEEFILRRAAGDAKFEIVCYDWTKEYCPHHPYIRTEYLFLDQLLDFKFKSEIIFIRYKEDYSLANELSCKRRLFE